MGAIVSIAVFVLCCFVIISVVSEGDTFADKVAHLIFKIKTFLINVDSKVKEKESHYYHRNDPNWGEAMKDDDKAPLA